MNAKDLIFVNQINVVKTQLDHTDAFLLQPDAIVVTKELDKIA